LSRAETYANQFSETVRRSEQWRSDRNAERKAKRAALRASDFWAVGDVVYNSWGYEQTNIDFYQVVEVKAKSIVIREIKQNSSDQGGPSGGMCAPRRNEFCGEPMLKPLDECGGISMRHGGASKWNGRPIGCSSYH
jgi:hypothetical protein